MKLSDFMKEKKSLKTLKEDDGVKIIENSEEIVFNFKDKNNLEKYSDFLFCAPTTSKLIYEKDELDVFFDEALKKDTEGLMLKDVDARYIPGLRVGNMVKLKEIKDDLDLVVLAGEYGQGKRAGFVSSFIVGVKDGEDFLEIGKVGSGVKEDDSDVSLQNLNRLLEFLKIREDGNMVYYQPKVVLQIRYQEILKSTKYNSGFALRFPRVIALRSDKVLEEINSLEDVKREFGD